MIDSIGLPKKPSSKSVNYFCAYMKDAKNSICLRVIFCLLAMFIFGCSSDDDPDNDFSSEAIGNISGTWIATNNENDILLFHFSDNGTYVHAEVDLSDQNEDSGMEWGTYTRDQNNSGLLTVSANIDTNGDTGLADGSIATPFAYTREKNDVLTFTFDGEDDLVLNKVSSTGIVGTWLAINDENDLLMFTFLDDGRYLHLEVDYDDSNETSGMELGTYQLNENTGLLTVSQTFDENGDTGFTDFAGSGSPYIFAEVTSGTLTFSIDDEGDTIIDDIVECLRQ